METNDGPSSDIYKPIQRWQTRLLRLHAGKDEDALHADLLVADMVQMQGLVVHDEQVLVDFSAISYAWGEPVFSQPIIVNGRRTWITKSLAEALHRFRYSDQRRMLWADALCINQLDAEEKSMQVRNMFNIFGKAKEVSVWLGPAGPFTAKALDWLSDFPLTSNAHKKLPLEEIGVSGKQTNNSALEAGLLDLCCRPWIRRAWVQQELFGASAVTIHCGSETVSFRKFKRAAKLLMKHEHIKSYMTEEQKICCSLIKMIHKSSLEERVELEAQRRSSKPNPCARKGELSRESYPSRCAGPECILLDTAGVLSSDPRDRIYALISMMNCQSGNGPFSERIADKPVLQVDYNRSPSLVFQDFTKFVINRYRSFVTHHPILTDSRIWYSHHGRRTGDSFIIRVLQIPVWKIIPH